MIIGNLNYHNLNYDSLLDVNHINKHYLFKSLLENLVHVTKHSKENLTLLSCERKIFFIKAQLRKSNGIEHLPKKKSIVYEWATPINTKKTFNISFNYYIRYYKIIFSIIKV